MGPRRLSARTLPDSCSGVGWGLIAHSLGAQMLCAEPGVPKGALDPQPFPAPSSTACRWHRPHPCPRALPLGMLLPVPEPRPSPVPRLNHGDAGCRDRPPPAGGQRQTKAHLPQCPRRWPRHWGRSSRRFLGRVSSTYRPARAQPENNQDTAKPRHERNCPGLGRADGASLSFPVCQSPDPSFCNDRGQPGLPAGHLLPRAVASGQGHRPGPVNGLGGQWAPV